MKTPYFLALIFYFLAAPLSTYAVEQNEKSMPQISSNFERIERRALVDIRLSIGATNFERMMKSLQSKYPAYHILSACVASFAKVGANDLVVGLVNEKLLKGAYVVLPEGMLDNETLALEEFTVSFNSQGSLEREIEVGCHSWTEIRRIRRGYESRIGEDASATTLRPFGHFDATCLIPPNSLHEYTCYEYDPKKNGFSKIGGWFND